MQTSVHQMESLLFSILLQMIVIIGAARTMNVAFRRLGQPAWSGRRWRA
jgi:Kef-type K+ transport system membrane component KefB